MSKETFEWLNQNILIGNTDERGRAWHYRASDQGDEPNHYAGFIPVGDVTRRLFYWDIVPARVAVEVQTDFESMTHLNDEGTPVRWVVQKDRKAVTRSDTGAVFEMFKSSYMEHQYNEWLLGNVSNILGDTLGITSAGLLKGGAIAWVEVSVPETIHNAKAGYDYRPNLLATTSANGTVATQYRRTVTSTVCDNTHAAALTEDGQVFKVRHSRYSMNKLADAKDAVGLVEHIVDETDAAIEQLIEMTVTDKQWSQFLDEWVPVVDKKGDPLKGRGLTMAETKREDLSRLYNWDERASQWRGNALGVVQAVNTHAHHFLPVRGATRAERNMHGAVMGSFGKLNAETLDTLTKVLLADA